MTAPRSVVVIGGGIAGLAAAWQLTGGAERRAGAPAVVVLEASERLGGPLCSDELGGRAVDTGPDGFLGRRPEAVDLCREVGLADALVPIAVRGASVWARGRLRDLPEGHAFGIPTRFWPTARAGILGPRGVLALARDALLPRPDVRGPIGDRAIGPLVARKLGQRVVDVLTDPLIGGIHAGSVDDMSAAATFPPLLAAAQRRGGLMRRAARGGAHTAGRRTTALLVTARRRGIAGPGARRRPGRARGRGPAVRAGPPARACGRGLVGAVRHATRRGRRRRPGHAGGRDGGPRSAPRWRGGGPPRGDRLRVGHRGDVPRRSRLGSRATLGHRLPRAPTESPHRERAVVRDGVHVPRPQVAPPGARRRGVVARLARPHRRHAPRRVER